MGDMNELKEALIYSQKIAQLSKAIWKSIEKDWQNWIKPFDLNINEHHILWITYQLKGAGISEIAKYGVMHVSTAFNFSKKLEERGYLEFSKSESDKRNTYVQLTSKGEEILLESLQSFGVHGNTVHDGSLPLKKMFGKYPELNELSSIVRSIYGDQFMDILNLSLQNTEEEFVEKDGKIMSKQGQLNPTV